jgi:hypothetical protein
MLVSHTCIFAVHPTEQEPKELYEPALVEDTNTEQKQR